MFISIRTKLLLMTLSTVVILSSAILYISINEHKRLYIETSERDFSALSQNISEDLVEYFAANKADEFTLGTRLLQLDKYPFVKFAAIANNNGELVQSYINPNYYSDELKQTIPFLINSAEQSAKADNSLILSSQIGDEPYNVGHFYLAIDIEKQLGQSQGAFIEKLIPLAIASLIFAFLFSNYLQTTAISPLLNLIKMVEKVEKDQDYQSVQSIKTQSNDEIKQLTESVRDMLLTIDKQQQANKSYTQTLVKQQAELIQLANYDQLTGLPNRKMFMDILSRYIKQIEHQYHSIAVILLDLDDFKTVNEAIGHKNGDKLLLEITNRLKALLTEDQVIARIGGDEFGIILPEDKTQKQAVHLCDQIVLKLNKNVYVDSWSLQATVSMGIAYAKPANFDSGLVLSNADVALYKAKQSGRNRYIEFVDAMTAQQERRLQIAAAIKDGLANDEFYLLYQPKVKPNEGVVGVEALIRWNSPSLGMISPNEFINIAEQTGRINDITRWVIEKGFQQLITFQAQFNTQLKVSFNLSSLDIFRPNFVAYLVKALSNPNINTQLIQFEITESAYIENFDTAQTFIGKIKRLGCSVALDDFGTGYSSLSYLTQVQADTIKVDQYFVRNLFNSEKDRKVTDAIISLAKKLGMTICAEGVETQAQYEYLHQSGVDQIQGYYFSKPVAMEQLAGTLKRIDKQLTTIAKKA
ncbi:diguanylate cyclase/phosphodiesterase [Catenovulum agarivorans DS-2]|uniref:Diguanylate cyclase/phosphodiesterase n=1 Tax=Catenovulum agarivorans DS-2 TaxID=1328313 RepID=W7QT47_9ALTE|nr:EAL domain-containing protein [Catenovulum agarivorans]EWH12202.1 diguanylate cyclase/phosphodiesterase [Catenovulum agarivorans DS-2]